MTRLTTERDGAIFSLFACALFLSACAVGWSHSSDAALEKVFQTHQAKFETLLADVQEDPLLTSIQRSGAIYAGRTVNLRANDTAEIERLGLTKERWVRYQKRLGDLGLYGVIKGPSMVEFRVDNGSLYNGDSYKGLEYILTPPHHLRASLDGYRISDEDKDQFGDIAVYTSLTGKWYLYLFVNH